MVATSRVQLQAKLISLLVQPIACVGKVHALRILAGIWSGHVTRAASRKVELETDQQAAGHRAGPL